MRVTWSDGKTSLNVSFYPKANKKSQVVVQHIKLKNAREAERAKKYWKQQLDSFKAFLEA